MTNILKIPAKSQAYLFAMRDAAADKFDVKRFAWPYLNEVVAGTVTIEGVVCGDGAGAYICLYDLTDNAVVEGSEVYATTFLEGLYYKHWGLVSGEIPLSALVDGHKYKLGGSNVYVYHGEIYLNVIAPTKFASWYRIGKHSSACYWDGGRDYRENWAGVNFLVDICHRNLITVPAAATVAYLECTGEVGPAGGGYGVAPRTATGTHDWYGSTISSCALTFAGGKVYQRSADILGSISSGKYGSWSGARHEFDFSYVLPSATWIEMVQTADGSYETVIEMSSQGDGGTYLGTDIPVTEWSVFWDPDKYDGEVTTYFEAVGYCMNNDEEYNVNGPLPLKLVTIGGTVVATISMADNSDDAWNEDKYWYDYYWYQVEFTPPAVKTQLTVQFPFGTDSWEEDAVMLSCARIRVVQTGANKVRSQIQLTASWGYGFEGTGYDVPSDEDDESIHWVYHADEIG